MLTTRALSEEIAPVSAVTPRWLGIDAATKFSGLSRSKIYQLLKSGAVRSVCLREPDRVRGTRLVNLQSLDVYISTHEGVWSEKPCAEKVVATNGGEHW